MDDRFFHRKMTADFIKELKNDIYEEICAIPNSDFLSYEKEELANYYFEKYKPDYITLYDLDNPNIDMDQKTTNEERCDFFSYNRNSTYIAEVDYVYWYITFRYTGDISFFHLYPNTRMESLSVREYENICVNNKDSNGIGTIKVTLKIELKNATKIEDIEKYIQNKFNEEIKIFKHNIENVNKDLKNHERNIRESINQMIEHRTKKIEETNTIFQKFKIPVKESGKTSFQQSIVINKKVVQLPTPNKHNQGINYYVDNKDISKINQLIYDFCSTMERTPKTYFNNDEEDIRNSILAALNTQYSNANGETFSNNGKTDIFIGQYGKPAYIAECKIWKGEKTFSDSIIQLLGYTTYKESTGTLIFFNKNVKGFKKLLDNIPNMIKNNERYVSIENIKNNVFEFTIKKNEEENLKIKLMIFNFYTEKDA